MPKATLKFIFPEERSEFNDAIQGTKWKLIVLDITGHLRNMIKYEDHPKEVLDKLEELRTYIFDAMNEDGLSLDE